MSHIFDAKQQASQSFEKAITRRSIRRWVSVVLRRTTDMLSFEAIRNCLHLRSQFDAGMQIVNMDYIVGSMGRSEDFDNRFLPRQEETRSRWESIARAVFEGKSLPPVELVKIGDYYFVVDGNHRISVFRLNGQKFIDAHVIEMQAATGEIEAIMCDLK